MDRINSFLSGWQLTAVDILVPIGILFLGWIVAVLASRAARRLLDRTSLDERITVMMFGENKAGSINAGRWGARIVYWIIMLFVIGAFLVRLQLAVAAEPINAFLGSIFGFAPRVMAAAALALVAWIIARVVKRLVQTALEKTKVDRQFAEEAKQDAIKPSKTISEAAYWLVFLLFLPAILGVLELNGILRPVEGMVEKFLGFVPNLVSAAVLFGVGWIVAKIVQRIVSSMLCAVGIDVFGEKYGVNDALGSKTLSEFIGLVVYILIIIPVAISALGALKIDSVTTPASLMLSRILEALPNIFGAALVLGISYFIGKFIAGLVANILHSAGFDRVLIKLGLTKDAPKEGQSTPSKLAGTLLMIVIMLFASMEAAGLLGFAALSLMVATFVELAGHIALGLAVFALGLLLGEFASRGIRSSGISQAKVLGTTARVAIIVLAGAMGLRQMGLANEIIILAFGLSLGAIAVAVALAFGLGAREQAGKIVEDMRSSWKDQE